MEKEKPVSVFRRCLWIRSFLCLGQNPTFQNISESDPPSCFNFSQQFFLFSLKCYVPVGRGEHQHLWQLLLNFVLEFAYWYCLMGSNGRSNKSELKSAEKKCLNSDPQQCPVEWVNPYRYLSSVKSFAVYLACLLFIWQVFGWLMHYICIPIRRWQPCGLRWRRSAGTLASIHRLSTCATRGIPLMSTVSGMYF